MDALQTGLQLAASQLEVTLPSAEELATFEGLQRLKRAAKTGHRTQSLRCHPDRGGSHEQQVSVNLAHDALCSYVALCQRAQVSRVEQLMYHVQMTEKLFQSLRAKQRERSAGGLKGCDEQWWVSPLADLVHRRPTGTLPSLQPATKLLFELTERAQQEGASIQIAEGRGGRLGVRLVRDAHATWAATPRHIVLGRVQASDLQYDQEGPEEPVAPLPPNRDPPQADGPQPGPPGVGLLRLCAPPQDTVAGCPSSGAAAAALKIENCETPRRRTGLAAERGPPAGDPEGAQATVAAQQPQPTVGSRAAAKLPAPAAEGAAALTSSSPKAAAPAGRAQRGQRQAAGSKHAAKFDGPAVAHSASAAAELGGGLTGSTPARAPEASARQLASPSNTLSKAAGSQAPASAAAKAAAGRRQLPPAQPLTASSDGDTRYQAWRKAEAQACKTGTYALGCACCSYFLHGCDKCRAIQAEKLRKQHRLWAESLGCEHCAGAEDGCSRCWQQLLSAMRSQPAGPEVKTPAAQGESISQQPQQQRGERPHVHHQQQQQQQLQRQRQRQRQRQQQQQQRLQGQHVTAQPPQNVKKKRPRQEEQQQGPQPGQQAPKKRQQQQQPQRQKRPRLAEPASRHPERGNSSGLPDSKLGTKRGSSEYRGVSRLPNGKWRAQIWHENTIRQIGRFATEEEAARAWDTRALELRGPEAKTNF
ncbi:hypothetical protein ABPG77_003423 [Micractinium sp. CCAP 211/92]